MAQCLAVGGATTAFPGTTAYTNARTVYNLANRYAPAAFVFPTTVVQVQNALQCSKQFGIGIVPRGGGHSYEDYSLGKLGGCSCLWIIQAKKFHQPAFPPHQILELSMMSYSSTTQLSLGFKLVGRDGFFALIFLLDLGSKM